MRREQLDDTLQALPESVAPFDLSGIASALSMIGGMGLLGQLVSALVSSPSDARTSVTHVWTVTPTQSTVMNDPTTIAAAFNATLKVLPPDAPVTQVATALNNFWHKLFG